MNPAKSMLSAVLSCLASCAAIQQGSLNQRLATAVLHNDTPGVLANCNRSNANLHLNGLAPIYYAASYGNEDMLDVLQGNGASLKSVGRDGRSLVYAASANGHAGTAGKLVAMGAGTPNDLAQGTAAFERRKASRAKASQLQAAALVWLAKAVAGGMFQRSDQDWRDEVRADQEARIAEMVHRGQAQ